MPKRSPSQHVPKDMQARFDEITKLTDAFCQTYLNDEYGNSAVNSPRPCVANALRLWYEAKPPPGRVESFMHWAW